VILLVVGQYVPGWSILAGEKQRNAAPRNRMREEFKTKPDYTERKAGIDRDNRAP
jgi:hypothetical protein